MEWWKTGERLYKTFGEGLEKATASMPSRKTYTSPPPLSPDFQPLILAADPYTAAAYRERTSLPCAPLSFKDISEGALSSLVSEELTAQDESSEEPLLPLPVVEMVICSFALHLVEGSSQLFSLLWELSLQTRWLVVLAPHKKPEIKEGWGWTKWNVGSWTACRMTDTGGELINDRSFISSRADTS